MVLLRNPLIWTPMGQKKVSLLVMSFQSKSGTLPPPPIRQEWYILGVGKGDLV